jgi:hypothetical protein
LNGSTTPPLPQTPCSGNPQKINGHPPCQTGCLFVSVNKPAIHIEAIVSPNLRKGFLAKVLLASQTQSP